MLLWSRDVRDQVLANIDIHVRPDRSVIGGAEISELFNHGFLAHGFRCEDEAENPIAWMQLRLFRDDCVNRSVCAVDGVLKTRPAREPIQSLYAGDILESAPHRCSVFNRGFNLGNGHDALDRIVLYPPTDIELL